MQRKKSYLQIILSALVVFTLVGCSNFSMETDITIPSKSTETIQAPSKTAPALEMTATGVSHLNFLSNYRFPDPGSFDPKKKYLFYLHGKIIEDQGLPAVSPDYGEYEYEAILQKLESYGFVVISEQRPKDTDGTVYAKKIADQVGTLLNAGVPAKNITVVGASKGAGIAIYVSHYLENQEVNFVIMAICHPDEVKALKQGQIYLYGNILSIYDSADEYAGSCQDLFSFSEGKGVLRHAEVVLSIGTGHGILYRPLDEWIIPTAEWARKP